MDSGQGVGWMGLERNSITFEKGQHEFRRMDFGVILLEKRISEGCPYVLEDWKQPATQ